MPWEPCGFPVVPWAHLIPKLPELTRKLRIALSCVGLDFLSSGLQEIGWHGVDVAHAFDVDRELLPALVALHGRDADLHAGPDEGDILQVDITQWGRVDFVVCGPPCPPWSTIGVRRASGDRREAVFRQVTRIIEHQGRLGCYGFVVEMVPGIDHRSRARTVEGRNPNLPVSGVAGVSYHTEWLRHLATAAPMFRVYTWHMESSDYLPQNRHRLYTAGVHRDVLAGGHLLPRLSPCLAGGCLAPWIAGS